MAGALDGFQVLDLSRILSGPYCTMVLADFGAEVIKVERPGSGDDTRAWGPPFVEGESAYYLSVNRNKRSITVDLGQEQGREIIYSLARERTGEGQFIDISLLDTQISWLTYAAGSYFATGEDPARYGSAHPSIVPYQPFATADGYLMLAVGNDRLWQQFCTVVDRPELGTEPGFATSAERVVNRDAVIAVVAAIMRGRSTVEWMAMLEQAGIPAGPINTIQQALRDPHVLAREMAVTLDHPTAGPVTVTGNPAKFSAGQADMRMAPPLLGQHTDEILRSLGYTESRIAELRARGVV